MAAESTQSNELHFDKVGGILIPHFLSKECFQSALDYIPKDGDIFIVTYPKCGTTWMQNIVINILRKGQPLNRPRDFFLASPFLDQLGAEDSQKIMIKPGAFKTHLPFDKVPWSEKAKYIHVSRNPKDCALSFFHHVHELPGYNFQNGNFDYFLERFLTGQLDYNDYFDHLLSWQAQRYRPNIFFTTFEEMTADLRTTIIKVADFLDQDYSKYLDSNPDVLDTIVQNCHIRNMRKFVNDAVNEMYSLKPEQVKTDSTIPIGRKHIIAYNARFPARKSRIEFIRAGKVNGWKTELTEEQNKKIDNRIKEKLMAVT